MPDPNSSLATALTASNFAKLGKGGPQKGITPQALATRMPSHKIAAKVGAPVIRGGKRVRVVRLKANG